MINEKKAANAMGGNTARACDSCLVKRARWFCAADDAFLCQRCDASVHSANQLASRHERVRLQTSSLKLVNDSDQSPVPAWHQGFTRKARTPRHNKPNMMQSHAKDDEDKVLQPLPFVPEIGSEEANSLDDEYENEDLEQLLYRVPIFDPFAAELCNNMSNEVGNSGGVDDDEAIHEMRMGNHEVHATSACELGNLQGFLPSDMELAEFAADVENLLGRGLDEDSSDLKGLGLLDCKEEDHDINGDVCVNDNIEDCRKVVKVEEELEAMELAGVGDQCQFNPSILDWNFDYDESSAALLGGDEEEEEKEEKVVLMGGTTESSDDHSQMMKRKIFLRLNYEAVITEWANLGSPWTTGIRPELNPEDGWPDCMGMWGTEMDHQAHGDGAGCVGGHGIRGDDRGREARVSRYREKRRTRLFSKKIRYEVRKLNAEKRPRMKGRFVKRSTMSSSSFVGVQGMMITSSSTTTNGSMNAFPYPRSAGSNNK